MNSAPSNPETRLLELLQAMKSMPFLHLPEGIHLSPPAITLLGWVARSPGKGVLDIAKDLSLSPPTVSVGIRRLARGGWLERRSDPQDRRARPIYLTPKGEEVMKQVHQHRTQMLRFFLSGLSTSEQEQLVHLLERAVSSMEEALKKDGQSPHQ